MQYKRTLISIYFYDICIQFRYFKKGGGAAIPPFRVSSIAARVMTEKEAAIAIENFFNSLPKNIEERVGLEAWARMNPQDAIQAIKNYAEQQEAERRKEAAKVPEGEIILAEEYFSDEQKIRIVAAMHPEGRYGNDNQYGITKADEQIAQLLFETVDTKSYDWEISLAMLDSCFRHVENMPEPDRWLMESIQVWDDWVRDTVMPDKTEISYDR